jgi:hypothetical protein
VLTGAVVDAETGVRLPLATLAWTEDGRRQGTTTTETGRFRLRLDGALRERSEVILEVSYVGYERQSVHVDLEAPPSELTVRLSPAEARAPEVVVESHALQSTLDTTAQALIRPDQTAGLGEENVLRALEPLPAVGITPALVEGISVRGSRPDAFEVLLDGIPVYNQSHLFGLFDAFNADALQAVGFYYGVTPVEYAAPPGGTLAFRTRTGAQSGTRWAAEGSPAAVSTTAEGPIADGQGSWLLSVRHSVLGVPWFDNDGLIAQGLGADRRTAEPETRGRVASDLLFQPSRPSARFFDIHAKGLWNAEGGGRWAMSFYWGGDRAEQDGQALRRDDDPSLRERLRRDRLDTTVVHTDHRWGSLGASLRWERSLSETAFSTMTLAASRYQSRYDTDQFVYLDGGRTDPRYVAAPFAQENEMVDLRLTHQVDLLTADSGTWTLGYAGMLYDLLYEEDSPIVSSFRGTRTSVQADLFAAYDHTLGPLDIQAGIRTHYFSAAGDWGMSPRLELEWSPMEALTVGLGYTRNHQFLHRLHLEGDVSSAVWIPSTESQPPGRVDHGMTSVTVRPTDRTTVRLDAYWKQHLNLRRHRSIARLRSDRPSVLFQPWTVRNESVARGIEAVVRHDMGAAAWTGAYTLSRVTLDPVGPADPRPADWDRRHQFTARLEWAPGARTTVFGTWTATSGPPNPYAALPGEPARLDAYHRLDLGAAWHGTTGPVRWTLRGTLFNAYNRSNPWHRTAVGLLRPDGADADRRPDVDFALVDVYDLGLRPSVSVSAAW